MNFTRIDKYCKSHGLPPRFARRAANLAQRGLLRGVGAVVDDAGTVFVRDDADPEIVFGAVTDQTDEAAESAKQCQSLIQNARTAP